MFNVRLAADHLYVASDVFYAVLFYAVFFPHEMTWMKSGTELRQFLKIFLPIHAYF